MLQRMPVEVIHDHILIYLSLEDLRSLIRSAHFLRAVVLSDKFWKPKHPIHFPYLTLDENKSSYVQFAQATLREYKGLNKRIRKLFFLAKSGQTQLFQSSYTENQFNLDDLFIHKDQNKLSPLEWIIRNKHQKLLDFIYVQAKERYKNQSGTEFHYFSLDKGRWCVAHWAAICNQSDLEFSTLLNNTAAYEELECKFSPLHVAVNFRVSEMVGRLVKLGLKVDGRTVEVNETVYRTSLHLAAKKGFVDVVEVLVRCGANVNAPIKRYNQGSEYTKPGENVINCAAEANHTEVVRLLVENKDCNIFVENPEGETPLSFAVAFDNKVLFDLLLTRVDKTKHDKVLARALCTAVDKGLYYYVQRLLGIGANPLTVVKKNGIHNNRSAYDLAVEKQSIALVNLLQPQNRKTKQYNPPDYFCSFFGPLAIVCGFLGFFYGIYLLDKYIQPIPENVVLMLLKIFGLLYSPVVMGIVLALVIALAMTKVLQRYSTRNAVGFLNEFELRNLNSHNDIEKGLCDNSASIPNYGTNNLGGTLKKIGFLKEVPNINLDEELESNYLLKIDHNL